MRNKCVQMSLYDTYKCVAASMEDDKPKLFRQLDEHIDWDSLIPARFYLAFYRNIGRPRKYPLVAFLKSLVLQKIFGYVNDSVLLVTLRHSREMRNFCGFEKVPDAAKLTRFKQDFLPYIMEVFERLVELTETICREMDAELAGSLIYDTTGIESYVAENNPKFFSAKLRQAKLMTRDYPKFCVTAKSGANRVKFIMGGRRVKRLPPCLQHNASGTGCQGGAIISPQPSI